MKQQSWLLWILFVAVMVLIGLQVYTSVFSGNEAAVPKTIEAERLRDYGATLKANQLYAKAAEAYDGYIGSADLSDSDRARIDFNTGTMLLDQLGDAEGALAHFLRVTEMYEDVDREILKEARKLSAQCLEKLGRSGAAERELVASSKLGATEASAEQEVAAGNVLATIGERVAITRTDFDEAWKEIPEYLRKQEFPDPGGKEKFLRELAGSRVFAEAARRKGLDRDPEIQRRRRMVEESLLSQKLFETEVAGKVNLPDSDLDLFYKAHLDHYTEPESVEAAHILVSSATGIQAARAAIDAGSTFAQAAAAFSEDQNTKEKEGRLGKIVQAPKPLEPSEGFDPLETFVPGIGKERDFVAAAFAMDEIGEVTGPVKTSKGYHLIQLLGRTPAVEKPLEQVKRQVEMELRAQREQERRAELVEELMKTHKVRIYADRLK